MDIQYAKLVIEELLYAKAVGLQRLHLQESGRSCQVGDDIKLAAECLSPVSCGMLSCSFFIRSTVISMLVEDGRL